jgi:hypothetical protein
MPLQTPTPLIAQEEGVVVTTRTKINFVGASVTVTEDAVNDRILVTIAGAGTGDMTKAVYDPENEGAIRLTPRVSSNGAEGTMFYDSDNNHVWVAME